MGVFRLLLAGSDAGHQGKVFRFKSFPQLVREPLHLPIYFGSSGSRMLQLAGEVADGVILNSITTPAHIHHARNMLKRGAEIAGREPAKTTIAASVIYAVAENIAAAAVYLPSFILMLSVLPLLEHIKHVAWMKATLQGISPAVIGVTAIAVLRMVPYANPDLLTGAMTVGTVVARVLWRLSPLPLMLGGASIGPVLRARFS